jgi:hypothetical protein
MKLKTKIVAAFTLTAAAALVPLSTVPAQAAPAQTAADYYIWVCNSPYSDDNIEAYNTDVAGYGRKSINQGTCKSINDRNGNARVDVDPAGGENDIDSYQIWTDYYPYGGTPVWGPCYNGENGASNPSSTGGKVSHYVTSKYACGAGV